MRASVIVNRRARRLALPGRLLSEIHRRRPGIEVIETTSLDELDAFVTTLRSRNGVPPVIVLAGGDGSYMAGVTALARAFQERPLPPIAFAPGGTVGTVARNWGSTTGAPVHRFARLLDALSGGAVSITRRPTLRVVDASGSERVGFIFGAGLVARFFEHYEARGAGGSFDAARIVARVFAGSFVGSRFARSILDPAETVIEVDGVPAPFERLSLLCASVVRNLGLGMHLTYRAGEDLGRFHAVGTPLGPRALGPQLPLVLAGHPLLGRRIDTLVKRLNLRFPTGRGAYVLDGDLFRADGVTVTAGPILDVVD